MNQSVQSDFESFLHKLQVEGKISFYQLNYIQKEIQLKGRTESDLLEEFGKKADYQQFLKDRAFEREKLRREQEHAAQLSEARDRIRQIEKEIADIRVQIKELYSSIEEPKSEYDSWVDRSKMFPDNPRFQKKVKELGRELAPFTEKIATLENMIEEKHMTLMQAETIKIALEQN